MNKCIKCNSYITWNDRSYLCEECYEQELKIKIRDPDRVVESPHSTWF